MKTVWTTFLVCWALCAQSLPVAPRPEDAGFDAARLERARQAIRGAVAAGRHPGAVLLLVRDGKVVTHDAFGVQAPGQPAPMRKDSIFPIASMSKPVVSTAAMILVEENLLDLGAPVARYLPEFANVKVGVEGAAPKRPPTVHDLLRHTSGLTYGFFGDSAVDKLYLKANLFAAPSLAAMVKTVATLPLLHHPGEAWEYSVSTDVLGRVIEVVSGQDIGAFIQERICGPLKMPDTGFWVAAANAGRVAKGVDPYGSADATARPALQMPGGGMYSTASDYARFAQMLLNGGQLDGVRILAPKTVALMLSDHIPPGAARRTPTAISLGAFGPTPEVGIGFGLGFAVREKAGLNPIAGSVGDAFWMGITGTKFWIDPEERLAAVWMAHSRRADNNASWRTIRTMVYQAMAK